MESFSMMAAFFFDALMMSYWRCLFNRALWHIQHGRDPYCMLGQILLSSIRKPNCLVKRILLAWLKTLYSRVIIQRRWIFDSPRFFSSIKLTTECQREGEKPVIKGIDIMEECSSQREASSSTAL